MVVLYSGEAFADRRDGIGSGNAIPYSIGGNEKELKVVGDFFDPHRRVRNDELLCRLEGLVLEVANGTREA